jgi:hypothetical protein
VVPDAIAIATEHVSFPVALELAGVRFDREAAAWGKKVRCPFGDTDHEDGGKDPSLRVYARRGWCFACGRSWTAVSLMAAVWGLPRELAAARLLRETGYIPPDYDQLWQQSQRPPEPDRDALEKALKTWCAAQDPAWTARQLDPAVANRLSQCLGLLYLVHTQEECGVWLRACKQAMQPYLKPAP